MSSLKNLEDKIYVGVLTFSAIVTGFVYGVSITAPNTPHSFSLIIPSAKFVFWLFFGKKFCKFFFRVRN